MAFLHNGNLQPTTVFSFYPCIRDAVYLEGLKEGESILFEHPYFYQNTDGYLAIDDRYTSFNILRNDKIMRTVNLQWENHCVAQTTVTQQKNLHPNYDNGGYIALTVFFIGVLTALFARGFLRAHR